MTDKEALSTVEKLIRQNVKTVIETFNPVVCALIDWSQPFKIINDVFEKYFPAEDHETFAHNVVEVTNLEGNVVYCSIKLEKTPEKVDILVSNLYTIDDIVDEESHVEDREIVKISIGKYMLAGMLRAAKENPPFASMEKTGCSHCGRSDLQLNIVVNADKGTTEYVCAVCMIKNKYADKTEDLPDLDDVEALIKKTKKMIRKLEKDLPKMEFSSYPEEIEMYAITPMSMYKSLQAMLTEYKVQKMKILMGMDNLAKLKSELKRALKNEDFELATILRDKIDKMG